MFAGLGTALHSTQRSVNACNPPLSRFTPPSANLLRRALSLQNRSEALERSCGLSLGDSAHKRAARQCAKRAKRGVKLVAVIEASAAVRGFAQPVLGAGTRTGGAASLPDSQLGRLALHQSPMYVEANSSQVDLLIHPQPDPSGSLVTVAQPAVNGDPITQSPWIHRHVPHLGRANGDLNRRGDRAHRYGTLSAPCSARGERLDALPITQRVLHGGVKRMKLDVEQLRHAIFGRKQVTCQSFHQRQDQLRALACD